MSLLNWSLAGAASIHIIEASPLLVIAVEREQPEQSDNAPPNNSLQPTRN
jgi:hypothetical protein